MRAALGIAVTALCLASQPALAGPGAASLGSAPLQDLRISGNTVRNHMQNAMRKLNVTSRLAAYYRALGLGALD